MGDGAARAKNIPGTPSYNELGGSQKRANGAADGGGLSLPGPPQLWQCTTSPWGRR